MKEMIHDKLELQATPQLMILPMAPWICTTFFFGRRTIRWNTHVDDKMEEAFTLRSISRLFHAYGILMKRVWNGYGTTT